MSEDNNGWQMIALGIMAFFVIAGIGLGVGLIIAFAKGSMVLAWPWVVPVSTVLGTGGLAVGVTKLTINVYKQAVREPYYWALPVFSVIAAVAVDFGKELYEGDGPLVKIIFGGVVLLLFLAGGALWKLKPVALRIAGGVCFVLPLALVCFKYAQVRGLPFWTAVMSIHWESSVFASLIVLLVMCLVCLGLCYYLRNEK